MRVAVTGSSGLVGTALRRRLEHSGHTVVPVVRRAAGPGEIAYDPNARTIDTDALRGVDAVVHLAGAGIGDKRWTDDYKRTILESRTVTTGLVSEALARLDDGPRVLLSASGINYYDDRGDTELDETASPGSGFLAEVCLAWEAATVAASEAGVRVAHLRSGIVLSPEGGALRKQLPLFRFGLGGKFGRGDQWQSWISIEDEVGAIEHLLTSEVSGPVNLTAPHPVTNAEFAQTLARVLSRPAFLPIPKFGPKLLLGAEAAETLLFEGLRVVPGVLRRDGYQFVHPELEPALRALLGR